MTGLPEEVFAVILARFPHPELQPWENPPDYTVSYGNNICLPTNLVASLSICIGLPTLTGRTRR